MIPCVILLRLLREQYSDHFRTGLSVLTPISITLCQMRIGTELRQEVQFKLRGGSFHSPNGSPAAFKQPHLHVIVTWLHLVSVAEPFGP